ncbi:site-specific integrase [Sulfitobacter sp. S0837]|uniref:site-specific integrase n=1 Tax=Sulfitobacter maritimus TaxID=2741719 RepID=UPI0015823470|nr:site-specific integrase [Sulfitobacter maritimus]
MKSSKNQQDAARKSRPSKFLRSKAGYEFDFAKDIWQLDGGYRLNLSALGNIFEDEGELCEAIRYTLGRLAVEASSSYTSGCLYNSLRFLGSPHFTGEPITTTQLQNFRSSLNRQNEYRLGHLRGFLRTLSDYGQKGLENDVIPYLDTLSLRGNRKGAAVAHRCPHSGPYTTTEQAAVLNWATNEFDKENISLMEYAWFYCSFVTGRRSVNLRALRAKDLKTSNETAARQFWLAVPRSKQRAATYRSQFREVLISEDLYLILKNLSLIVSNMVEECIPDAVPVGILQELPIFADRTRVQQLGSLEALSKILRETPDFLHATSSQTAAIVGKLSHMCTAISERTGDTIHITQTRMRRSRATNLRRKGIGGTELAYLLDHSDTQQIGVYTENTPNVAERIDEAMLPALAPLAMAARGMLIDSERDAIRANDPNSRIHKAGGASMGNCGNEGFCAGGIKSCLVCTQFQPWIDAPWDELLTELLDERDELRQYNVGNGVLQSYDLQISRSFAIKTAAEQLRSENG